MIQLFQSWLDGVALTLNDSIPLGLSNGLVGKIILHQVYRFVGIDQGPACTRKNFMGAPSALFVQAKGIAGEWAIKTVFQSVRLVEV